MNCGPWSVHTLCGTPVRQKDDFNDNMSFAVVVLVIIGVILGQSEKQSTVMRDIAVQRANRSRLQLLGMAAGVWV